MKVLETARLDLRWLTADDAPFMLGLLNEPSFIENIGDRGVRTTDAAREYIEKGAAASYREHGYGLYLVERRSDGTPVGICGLIKRPFLADADVGFAFLPAYWSQGYAIEAAQAVMGHARNTLGLERVIAIVSPGNAPSVRLLRKLGLEFERMMEMPTPGDTVAVYVPGHS
ncbi:MAG TPA: GNAT family N-acetyltransferase [Steroidobacteraceae bacterium]